MKKNKQSSTKFFLLKVAPILSYSILHMTTILGLCDIGIMLIMIMSTIFTIITVIYSTSTVVISTCSYCLSQLNYMYMKL